jgi:DnaJ-class molecular chaperone
MHHITRGMTCWKCNGSGLVVEATNPHYTLYTSCHICSGVGNIKQGE